MSKDTLLVAIRGWTTTGDWWLGSDLGGELRPSFIQTLERKLPRCDVWAPDLDMGMFSMRLAESLCMEVVAGIRQKLLEHPELEHIVLLGFSSGSLLARRVFCIAHGAAETGEVTQPPEPWANRIDRLVVLAGITRGWEYTSVSPAYLRFISPVLPRLTALLSAFGSSTGRVETPVPLIMQLRRGSPFVVSTRIQYVNVFEALRLCPAKRRDAPLRVDGRPSTVFLLGAQDQYLSPADCSELGPRTEFVFVEVGATNHTEALEIEDPPHVEQAASRSVNSATTDDALRRLAIKTRRERIVCAISAPFAELNSQEWAIPAGDIDDYLDPMDLSEPGPKTADEGARVDHAVMVLHGIRDHGFWTKRIAREIKTLGRDRRISVRAPSPSYGYFSLWDFVKPGGRDAAARWFMEKYADVKSHFPNAQISFVGHSNGTYLAARALELCPAIQFRNVVFAGSVVRRSFRWSDLSGQVRCVLNYVGNKDWVVAFLPAVFEKLRWESLDVGGAGAYGFLEAEPEPGRTKRLAVGNGPSVELTEVRFVNGQHDAAIKESYWKEIAQFALEGTLPPVRETVDRPTEWGRAFRNAPVLTAVLVVLAMTALASPLLFAALATNFGLSWLLVTLAVAAGLGLSWVTSRFLRMW